MLKFISFGSGSSGNNYALYTDSDALMIDAGVGVRSLKKHAKNYGLPLSRVHSLLVTHDHADHIKCVGSMSHELHLPVYATEAVHQGIDRNYCVAHKVDAVLRHYLVPGNTVELGSFRVTPFAVPHDSSDNVGYQIEAQGITFCIITDAGRVTEEMGQYIGRADFLVLEANHDVEMLLNGPYPQHLKTRIQSGTGHLNNRVCAESIAQYMGERLRHVWLCHLSQENNHPELARKTVETILRSYGIIVGKDLQLDVLKRTMPSGPYDLVPSQLSLFDPLLKNLYIDPSENSIF
ncbi:MAG: MBL fold metallo-hydrolase [Prevotella sp.]|nr:MBL fold metallo-hydrolase [Prevotella sp.]